MDKSVGIRARARRKELGLTQTQVGALCNLSQQTIQNIESGRNRSTGNMVALAYALKVRPAWLAHGTEPKFEPSSVSDPPNVALDQPIPLRGRVPIISWVQAGDWAEAYEPITAEDWIDVTCEVRRSTFALRVVGDSMEPDFKEGSIIVVEPDMQVEPGHYVIIRNGDEATFKQLIKDGTDWYLKPLNERYPIKPLDPNMRIIGVVREVVRKFR